MAKKDKMMTTNMMFALILAWSILSTTLMVVQYHRNIELQQQLSSSAKSSIMMMPNEDERANQTGKHLKIKSRDQRREQREEKNSKISLPLRIKSRPQRSNEAIATTSFPFTRSLDTFTDSENFYIYVVQSTSPSNDNDQNLPLQWSEVRWKDLVTNWGRTTTFSDIIELSTPLQPENDDKSQLRKYESSTNQAPKMVIHCLPKTASTTLRVACRKHLRENCQYVKQMKMTADPYGYRDVNKFFDAVDQCPDIHHYCVQGGDAKMTILNYEGADNEDDGKENEETADESAESDAESSPHHFVHLVPFRNFDEWAASALKQIYVIDGQCHDIDNLLEQCLGYRELYMELYPKSVLALQIGMALNANRNKDEGSNVSSNVPDHQHHIVLYNYKETDAVATEISNFFDVPPMPRTDSEEKKERSEGSCPAKTLERFHECHDETLVTLDAIMDLEKERKRRFKDVVKTRKIRPSYKYIDKETGQRKNVTIAIQNKDEDGN